MTTPTYTTTLPEQTGVITFKGSPMTLLGSDITVGSKAPEFTVLGNDMSPITLSSSTGKTRLIVSVPSIDTPVCDTEVRRFNTEATSLPNTEVLVISMDLPFAQKRWCGSEGITNVTTGSDYRDASFGGTYGVLIKELRLDARAIFVIDPSGTVVYKEIVSEVTSEPNYEAALTAAKQTQLAGVR
ncbi:MAG: thiol peroxidase [Vampirovibrionales bacterium]|nr:thiol peroxidase [Vampirovibrionales bacterium]